MKRLTLLLLACLLAGCSALQTVPPTPQPTPVPPTPQVILATVLVTVIPTDAPTLVPVPTNTSVPTIQLPTQTEAAPATETSTPVGGGPVTVPASLNGSSFASITLSGSRFSLRCEPKTIFFDLTVSDLNVSVVEFYYRIRDKASTYVPDWSLGGSLNAESGGHFFLTYGADQVVPDNRKVNGWFDIQFVGLNKLGQVVGRTEKIVDLVTYTLDCP